MWPFREKCSKSFDREPHQWIADGEKEIILEDTDYAIKTQVFEFWICARCGKVQREPAYLGSDGFVGYFARPKWILKQWYLDFLEKEGKLR